MTILPDENTDPRYPSQAQIEQEYQKLERSKKRPHRQTILDRVRSEAQTHNKCFSVVEVLFAINVKRHGPMVDLHQVHHALDQLARAGVFEKISAGRYRWSK